MPTLNAARAELENAFPRVPIDTTTALDKWGRMYTSQERFLLDTNGKRWSEITAASAEWHHDVLRSLDPTSLAQLLPALLSACLTDEGIDALPRFLCSVLTPDGDDDEHFNMRVAALSNDQLSAVASSLRAIEEQRASEGKPRFDFLDKALARFWHKYER
jgi:hypothetical protein